MTRRVLHPSDFLSASNAAFKKAIGMAKASRAELLVAHVIRPDRAGVRRRVSPSDVQGRQGVEPGAGEQAARPAGGEGEEVGRSRDRIARRRGCSRADRSPREDEARGSRGHGHARALGAREAVCRKRGRAGRGHSALPSPDRPRQIIPDASASRRARDARRVQASHLIQDVCAFVVDPIVIIQITHITRPCRNFPNIVDGHRVRGTAKACSRTGSVPKVLWPRTLVLCFTMTRRERPGAVPFARAPNFMTGSTRCDETFRLPYSTTVG